MAIQIGEFFFDPAFVFADGIMGEKLFIVLARSKADNFIVARTTTNPQHKSFHFGCHNDEVNPSFCVPKTADSPFKENTWVNLDYLSEFDSHELTNRVERLRNIQRIGNIPLDMLKAIMDCAARADDTLRYQSDAIRDALTTLP